MIAKSAPELAAAGQGSAAPTPGDGPWWSDAPSPRRGLVIAATLAAVASLVAGVVAVLAPLSAQISAMLTRNQQVKPPQLLSPEM